MSTIKTNNRENTIKSILSVCFSIINGWVKKYFVVNFLSTFSQLCVNHSQPG